jgi:hypothetical protein
MRPRFYLSAALVLGAVSSLSAQTTVTPFVGSMIPLQSLLLDTAGASGFRMQVHTIYGVRITKPMSPSLGVEFAFGAGSGTLEAVSAEVFELQTAVYFADLRARFRVAGDDNTQVGAILGAGWTQYSSGLFDAAHEGDDETSFKGTVTGIFGLGMTAKLSDRITLSVDATDRIHEQGIDAPGLSTGQFADKLQHDLTFSAGLSFPLGR